MSANVVATWGRFIDDRVGTAVRDRALPGSSRPARSDEWTFWSCLTASPRKALSWCASSAFYSLGTVQSLGNFPDPRASICEMHAEESARRPLAHRFYFPLMSRGAALGMKVLFSRSVGFASIMEDLPYADNRVMVSDRLQPKLFFQYELHPNERRRIKKFRKLVSGALRPRLSWLHSQAENNQRLAPACGTCRMGDRAESSVVDSSNKVHGIDNLYIVDASVFPTSSGINPSLTIAALALRAAEKIRQRFEKRVSQ